MSLDAHNLEPIDGSGYRFAIVAASYNQSLVDSLVSHASETLTSRGAPAPEFVRVPGSAELPYAASVLAERGEFDAIICIGVVIAGDTNHHNIIGDSTAIVLQELSVQSGIPAINGILVVENLSQAEARAGTEINRGKEFADAALAMAAFKKQWKTNKNQ